MYRIPNYKVDWHVLPIGRQNLVTGKNLYFNIYDDWDPINETETLVLIKKTIYKKDVGNITNICGIWGSGAGGYIKDLEEYPTRQLIHDQTQAYMYTVKPLQEVVFEPGKWKEAAKKVMDIVGSKSLQCYVFK